MFRSLSLALAAALFFAATSPSQNPPKKSALDKATLEAYVRHLFVLDSRITLQVSDPKPSTDLPGFQEVAVRASLGPNSQEFKFLVSKDGQKILQGNIYDIANNPFKRDLDKLKTDLAPNIGTPGAPVVLVEFSDFQCPYCKEEATMLRQNLLSAYPKQVRLYFKTFPLDMHPWAKPAAVASLCVNRQKSDLFWEYHDWVFAHQGEITPENLKDKVLEWAKGQKALDALQLTSCMDSSATIGEVEKNIAEGRALEINGTPTLFINGRRIPQTIDWTNLRTIIDYEIEYQKTAKNAGEDCGCTLELKLPGVPQQQTLPMTPPKKN
ncbi:MAG TPA: thioredoxin domain-containing protein [Bryobacteraceae bacterium]|nr:thioredoxin domain-containing protein [Bryobacteraceae bacterium]